MIEKNLILLKSDAVVLPGNLVDIQVQDLRNIRAIEGLIKMRLNNLNNRKGNDKIWFGLINDEDSIGTFCDFVKSGIKNEKISISVQGVRRFSVKKMIQMDPFLRADVEVFPQNFLSNDPGGTFNKDEVKKIFKKICDLAIEVFFRNMTDEANMKSVIANMQQMLYSIKEEALPDVVATFLHLGDKEKRQVLQLTDYRDRLIFIYQTLKEESLNDSTIVVKKKPPAYKEKDEDLKTSKSLLKPTSDQQNVRVLLKKLEKLPIPEDIRNILADDVNAIEQKSFLTSEQMKIFDYLTLVSQLPWGVVSEDNVSLDDVQRSLNADHYAMKKVKKRLIDYIAVQKFIAKQGGKDATKSGSHPILCLVGPPGVGKTSVARSIASSLGRKYHRIALGGASDRDLIRGTRRTYVGSMCGKIINALKACGTSNPVIVLDEVDKLGWCESGTGDSGNLASTLLEVLDPEQNCEFVDNYLNFPFDLSSCIFITTANIQHDIPIALRDRMETIKISGYSTEEKIEIAQRFLFPKQKRLHRISRDIILSRDFVRALITGYTREAGVRDLDRHLAAVSRYIIVELIGEDDEYVEELSKEVLKKIFGQEKYSEDRNEYQLRQSGCATGLSYTPTGGHVMVVESVRTLKHEHKQQTNVKLTGQLGDVLKESAHIALSWIQNNLSKLQLKVDINHFNYHIHLPSGGIPKDGPSAGVTLATSLYSLLSGKLVRDDVVMTGEITLRGVVLPVGGIKEKVLAAHRLNYDQVILPLANKKDVEEDLSEEIRSSLRFYYVSTIEEVFQTAFDDFDLSPFRFRVQSNL